MQLFITLILLASNLLLGFTAPRPLFATITVDTTTSYQTINRWEATAQAGQEDFSDIDDYRETLMDMAVADGINGLRLEIRTRDENDIYAASPSDNNNDNADPFSINAAGFQFGGTDKEGLRGQVVQIANELRQRLAAQNETLFTSLCFVDFRFGASYFEHGDSPEEYAELMEATFSWINTNHGWVPDAVEVILEPDNGQNTSSWTASDIAACIIATQSRLAGHGWNPRFIVPSTTACPSADTWYADAKTANGNITQYIDELAYHRYQDCDATSLGQNRDAAEADGNSIAMLEMIGADYTVLHDDLKTGRASSWQQFTIAYDSALGDDGSQYYLPNHTTHAVSRGADIKLLKQYFKYVRRGAVRKATSSGNGNLDALAFRNLSGNYAVVVKCLAGATFTISGVPDGTYHVSYALVSGAYDQTLSDVTITGGGDSGNIIMPSAGVVTIYADAMAAMYKITGKHKLSGITTFR